MMDNQCHASMFVWLLIMTKMNEDYKTYSMNVVCDLLCNGVSILLSSGVNNCCSIDFYFSLFLSIMFSVVIALLVSSISLRVLCGCFIYSDEVFPAAYCSVPWCA